MSHVGRRVPRLTNLLCAAIAGAILLLPLNTSAEPCKHSDKCLTSSVVERGTAGAGESRLTSMTQQGQDSGFHISFTLIALVLVMALVLITVMTSYHREAND